jgi:hypothetical protein
MRKRVKRFIVLKTLLYSLGRRVAMMMVWFLWIRVGLGKIMIDG